MNTKTSTGFITTAWGRGDRFSSYGLPHTVTVSRTETHTWVRDIWRHSCISIGKWYSAAAAYVLNDSRHWGGDNYTLLHNKTAALPKDYAFIHELLRIARSSITCTSPSRLRYHHTRHYNGLFTQKTFNTAHVHANCIQNNLYALYVLPKA